MLNTTQDAIRAVMRGDPTLSPSARARLMAIIRAGGTEPESKHVTPTAPRILRRKQVAERLNRSIRSVDALAKAEIIHKIRLPGRVRSCGFRESEIVALIQGAANE